MNSLIVSRRNFLALLGAALPAAAPTYFFAPVGGWQSEPVRNPHLSPLFAAPYGSRPDEVEFVYWSPATVVRERVNIRTGETVRVECRSGSDAL